MTKFFFKTLKMTNPKGWKLAQSTGYSQGKARDRVALIVKEKRRKVELLLAFVRCRWARITKVLGFMLGCFYIFFFWQGSGSIF